MNRLSAYIDGSEVGEVLIRTGSEKGARRVPARWARHWLANGAEFRVHTSRGPKPRRIVEINRVFYTRGGAA